MVIDPTDLAEPAREFLAERHLATLSLVRPNGRPHVTPVGVTWDGDRRLARVITWSGSVKARMLDAHPAGLRAAVCQVDGGRWLTLEGVATVTGHPEATAEAVRRYAERYRPPKDRGPERRAIEIDVDRILGSSAMGR